MAADVHENVFSEEQLFTPDVRGEDEDYPGDRRIVPPEWSSAIALAKSKAKPREVRPLGEEAPAASAAGRRRKRAADRATKILVWLESKYEILPEVCSEFENWKEASSANADFDLLWCDSAIPADRFMKLKTYQKMNHFVGMSSITRKNNLGRNLLRMRKQFPKEYRFFPDTWILPTDMSDFKQQFAAAKKQTFIIKPDNGCQGKGIFLIRDVEKVPVDFSSTYVAQRYISKPLLLDGYKFDLRLYVLVSGCDPLRIFLHRRGLVRLASEQYVEPTKNNLSEVMVHLTNYAINKTNPNFEENTNPDDAQDGHKRSWEAVQEHLRQEGHDVDTLLAEIEDLIVKTLIAVQPSLSHFYHSCQPDDVYNGMSFEILGFDVMLDQKLQPWLLEVNHAPSFATESELDRLVKEEVLRDSFNLLDLNPEARRQKKREAREKMEQRAMGMAKKYCIEDRVTQEREFALLRTEWEDQQLQSCESGYKRLYPSPEKEKDYWQVHDAAINIWEMLMGGTFRRAVRLSDPVEKPALEDRADSKARAGSAKTAGNEKDEPLKPEKRTAEEIREVVERLAQGCSARPRRNASRRRSGKDDDKDETAAGVAQEEALPEKAMQPEKRSHTNRYVDVQVGDVIKVQTNLGWETVTVRAKRPGTGKIDIQFKDGEYMRAVMPRILRNSEGQPVKDAVPETAAPSASPASGQPRARPLGVALGSSPAAPVPSSTTGAVPQKLAGYKGGMMSPAGNSRGHPLPAADDLASELPTVAQDALVGVLLEGCGVTEIKDARGTTSQKLQDVRGGEAVAGYSAAGDGLPSPSASTASAPGRGVRSNVPPLGNRAPAVRLKQQLQQLISARPIIAPKVGRSGSVPRTSQQPTAPEPLLGHGLVGSALAPRLESKAARRRSSDT
ncbi:Ttll6a [Symbiodinium pilosum]|uniref:Ttll6a protein n=1 Tax=Symbiodinium pilosum TaxID=2952 RepID=A0A812J0E4_SYMPI|nr:Ttll6a [Symbiodinium pilosum]